MSGRFWRWFSAIMLVTGGVLVVWGFIARSNSEDGINGLASNIQAQALIFSGAVIILIGVINLVVYKLFRPLTQAGDNLMVAQGYKPGLGGTMAMAADSMAQANATMAAFNAGPNLAYQVAASGVEGTGTVTGARPTGQQSNLNPVYELDMTINVAGMSPYAVTHTTEVNTLRVAQVAVGRQLPVRVNPADPRQMLVQWEKVPVS
jgi:hypothetical protein